MLALLAVRRLEDTLQILITGSRQRVPIAQNDVLRNEVCEGLVGLWPALALLTTRCLHAETGWHSGGRLQRR